MIDPDGRDWYRNYETGKIIWREGNSKMKGYAHLGYSWGKTFANGNRILLDGERKQIIYNGTQIVADYNRKKSSGFRTGGMAISDGGNNQDPSSLDKGGRSGEWFDFKGTLDVIIALLANELRGLKLGGGALDDKIGDGINAIDNASNAIKTIKGAGEEEKIDMQIKVYTTTDILRDNDSQVHEGKPRDTSVIASDSVKINALNKRNYNIKKQEAERKNIIYKQNK